MTWNEFDENDPAIPRGVPTLIARKRPEDTCYAVASWDGDSWDTNGSTYYDPPTHWRLLEGEGP